MESTVYVQARVPEEKFKLLKKRLIDKNISIQEWINAHVDRELAKESVTS